MDDAARHDTRAVELPATTRGQWNGVGGMDHSGGNGAGPGAETDTEYDVLIIGARVAGASLALLLGQRAIACCW